MIYCPIKVGINKLDQATSGKAMVGVKINMK
jgi:hypothetical protein